MQETNQPGADTLPREEFLTRQSGSASSPTPSPHDPPNSMLIEVMIIGLPSMYLRCRYVVISKPPSPMQKINQAGADTLPKDEESSSSIFDINIENGGVQGGDILQDCPDQQKPLLPTLSTGVYEGEEGWVFFNVSRLSGQKFFPLLPRCCYRATLLP